MFEKFLARAAPVDDKREALMIREAMIREAIW